MNKTLLIIGGVAAVGIVGYMLLKKKPSAELTTNESSAEQKSADISATIVTPSTSPRPLGINTAVKGGVKTDIKGRPVVSSTSTTSPTRSASTPKLSNETESYAFSLNF
jgi:hypothetical protein